MVPEALGENLICAGTLCVRSLWHGADFSWFSEILEKRSYEFCGRCFYDDLARVQRSTLRSPSYMNILAKEGLVEICRGPYEKMLWRSWWNPARDPSMILYRSSSENLVERSSLRGPCMKILHMPCISGACMKSLLACLWEVLVSRSCKIRSSSSRSFYDDLVGFS